MFKSCSVCFRKAGMWTPSGGIISKSGFMVQLTTLQCAFCHRNDGNLFRRCEWAAFEKKGMFLTAFIFIRCLASTASPFLQMPYKKLQISVFFVNLKS